MQMMWQQLHSKMVDCSKTME